MTNKSRYLPTNHGQFDLFYKNIKQYVEQKTADSALGVGAEWKHIPNEALEALNDEYASWNTAYGLTLVAHTPAETLGKQNAYKMASRHLRGFINQYLRFPPVTDMDRLALGIRNPAVVRTSRKLPEEKVDFYFQLKDVQKIEVRFKVRGATSRAKPHGYHGAVIAWDLLDKPPTRHAELTRHVTATRTPYTLEFDEDDRGKTVYVAVCWQNAKGQNGSWTVMQSAIVP
jgi:hypothetical protein